MFPREKKSFFEKQGVELSMSPDSVRVKWNSLVTSYKRIKDNASGKKTGRGALEAWPFFSAMDEILGSKASTKPEFLLQTGVPESGETKENVDPNKSTPVKRGNDSMRRGTPRKRGICPPSDYFERKLQLEEQRLALEERRLLMENRRLELLGSLVSGLAKGRQADK